MTALSKNSSYGKIVAHFGTTGCTVAKCPYGSTFDGNKCALNVHDAIIKAGYRCGTSGSQWKGFPLCPHERMRSAQGMEELIRSLLGAPDAVGWANRPNWAGLVFFGGNFANATGHVDLWNGKDAVHTPYPNTSPTYFWKLAA
jgi:hypothetical protein